MVSMPTFASARVIFDGLVDEERGVFVIVELVRVEELVVVVRFGGVVAVVGAHVVLNV